jgi:O-methyltransferase
VFRQVRLRGIETMLKNVIKSIVFRGTKSVQGELESLQMRVKTLEVRLMDQQRSKRYWGIDEMTDYLVGAEVEGDYFEFGVYRGVNFAYAARKLGPCFPHMRYYAVDSFEGLPAPRSIDAIEGYTGHFHEKDYACSHEEFLRHLQKEAVDLDKVTCIKGWFHKTLRDDHPQAGAIRKIAAAYIDCDLYESTVPVLQYLTRRLSVGSILLFDDWRNFRNLPDRGQQRACREWLENNPALELRELFSIGFNGIALTVSSCPSAEV